VQLKKLEPESGSAIESRGFETVPSRRCKSGKEKRERNGGNCKVKRKMGSKFGGKLAMEGI
jgi:hypothetical protein